MKIKPQVAKTICQSAVCLLVLGCESKPEPAKPAARPASGAIISDVTDQSFVITYRNTSDKPILIDSYYFGYAVEVEFANVGVKKFDFGADKVPVPLKSDLHVLTPGQNFGWRVSLPSEWGSARGVRRISYISMYPASNIPKHIDEEYPNIQRLRLRAEWKSGT
jgi:hypothetical protein